MTVTTNWPARIAYTFDEAVFASGVPRRTLQYAIKEGRLKSYFSAGRRRVFPADLEEFLRGGSAAPVSTVPRPLLFGAAQPQ